MRGHLYRGLSRRLLGDQIGARQDAELAILEQPEDWMGYKLRAQLEQDAGETDKGDADFKKAAALNQAEQHAEPPGQNPRP